MILKALGPGRVELNKLDTLIEQYSGSLHTGGELRKIVEESRNEWD